MNVVEHGLFGPDAVARRVVGHPAALIGGMRALILQSLHPLAMAGVAQHSDFARRPLDRLRRTSAYVLHTTFGSEEDAVGAAERVKRMHRRVRGVDPVTGTEYSADDPETQLWVHCVEWHSFLAAYRAYGGRLSREEQDRYLAEGVRVAALLDVDPASVPTTVDEQRAYFAAMRPKLCVSDYARDAIDFVIEPPLSRELLPYLVPMRIVSLAAVAIVPRDLRRLAGIDRPRAVDQLTVAAVRPAAAALTLPVLREAPRLVVAA